MVQELQGVQDTSVKVLRICNNEVLYLILFNYGQRMHGLSVSIMESNV